MSADQISGSGCFLLLLVVAGLFAVGLMVRPLLGEPDCIPARMDCEPQQHTPFVEGQ